MGYRNIPLAVKHEYGESLSDVIKGLADLGYSRTVTARVLGMDHSTLARWLGRLGLDHHFVPGNYNESCRPRGTAKPGRQRIYSDDELLKVVIQCGLSSWQLRNDKSSPTLRTIINRFGSWGAAKQRAKEICRWI